METRWKIVSAVALVVALGLVLLSKVVPVCTDMVATASGGQMPMRCHYTFRAQLLFAISSVLAAGTLFFVRSNDGRKVAGVMLAALGIMMLILPLSGVSGICRHDHAPCHDTAFWNSILSTGQIAIGLLVVFLKSPASFSSAKIKGMPTSTGEKIKWLD